MGEPREVGEIGEFLYRLFPTGNVEWADSEAPIEYREWFPERTPEVVSLVREVACLQDDNEALRNEVVVLRGELDEHADASITRFVHGPGCECYTCA